MTRIDSDEVQRKRGELRRDGVGRRPPPVTAARLRLRATRPSAARDNASHHGPRDARFDYLTHSHD
jgi:hypothetical protein